MKPMLCILVTFSLYGCADFFVGPFGEHRTRHGKAQEPEEIVPHLTFALPPSQGLNSHCSIL